MNYEKFVELFDSGTLPELTVRNIDFFFVTSCRKGHLDIAKWLWNISYYKIKVHACNHKAFQLSCENGHLVVAKWLWEISSHKINISARNYYTFKQSCFNYRLEVAKWLWVISRCTISFSVLKEYHLKLQFLNLYSIKKYKYKYTDKHDNLHIIHYYYKPADGPGYLYAINDKN